MKELITMNISQDDISHIHLSRPEDLFEDNLFKINNAINNGVKGIEIIINYKLLKGEQLKKLKKQIIDISQIIHLNGCLVKIIIESEKLTFDQVRETIEIWTMANVDFVKFQQI